MESPHHMWSNHHVKRSPVFSPRCDAGSGSGRRICTPGRLPGVKLSNSVITLVQVRSHGMAEIANGGHITVRSEARVGHSARTGNAVEATATRFISVDSFLCLRPTIVSMVPIARRNESIESIAATLAQSALHLLLLLHLWSDE